MYDVEYYNGKWWLTKDGEVIKAIGGFCEPITPELIKEVIEDEINME
jgi:hypothetical protein